MNSNSIKNQEIKRKFVEREIIYCVSNLIYELSSNEEYQEELLEAFITYDYEQAAIDYINSNMSIVECMEWLTFQEGSIPGTGNAKNQ